MEYTVKHIQTAQELDKALALEKKVLGVSNNPAYARVKWLERMKSYGDLMLYAEIADTLVGIVFGRVEEESIIIGPVAVDEDFRKYGIARELMLSLEERALQHGIHQLTLGAREAAEGFYEKLGYTGVLLIQSEKHTVDELLALNVSYQVTNTNLHEGVVSQVYLAMPTADRELQHRYDDTFPGCHSLMVYSKILKVDR